MRWLQPWWLVLLVPWAGLVILALRQYRPKVLVPYLDLWPREEIEPKQRRHGWRPPAWPVALLLVAMLLGIGAVARPVLESSQPALKRVTIILDRGITMLAGDRASQAADRAIAMLEPLMGDDSEIRVVDTAGGNRLVSHGQLAETLRARPMAVQTHEWVRAIAASTDRPTVAITDAADLPADVVQIAPEGGIRNVGIVRAATADGQCLVEIRNDSDLQEVQAQIAGAKQRVELPPRGEVRQYVLAGTGEELRLNVNDDLAEDNLWRFPPQGVKVEASASAPRAVRRLAEAYAAARKGSGPTVRIVTAGERAEERSVIVVPADTRVSVPRLRGDHAILWNVQLPAQVMAAARPLPEGRWEIVLSAGDNVLLAVDPERRRVWLGMDLPEESPERVVLWTNAVEYAGGNGAQGITNVSAPVLPPVQDENQPEAQLRRLAQEGSQRAVWPWLWASAGGVVAMAVAVALLTSRRRAAIPAHW